MTKEREGKYLSKSLCWSCRHAVPTEDLGCPWSINEREINGWVAQPSKIHSKGYQVMFCPLYERDSKPEKMCGDDIAYVRLGFAVATQCVDDYRLAYEKQYLNEDWYALCIKRRKEYERVRDWIYGKKARARRRRNDKMLDYMDDIHERFKKRFTPYFHDAYVGEEVKKTLKSCQWFFQTEEFQCYTDMDGMRVMHTIEREVKRSNGKE